MIGAEIFSQEYVESNPIFRARFGVTKIHNWEYREMRKDCRYALIIREIQAEQAVDLFYAKMISSSHL